MLKWPFTFRASSGVLTLLVSFYFLLVFNRIFFSTIADIHGLNQVGDYFYIISLFVFLWMLVNLFLTCVAFPFLLKPVLVVLCIASSVAVYFMQTYNILIDKTMIQNAIETNVKESAELFSFNLLLSVLIMGVLPSLVIVRTHILYRKPTFFLVEKLAVVMVSGMVIAIVAVAFYQDYASLFRNNRYVRHMIVPVNYIHAINGYTKSLLPVNQPVYEVIGADAHLGPRWQASDHKRVVSVIVVGETARHANFSLYGYDRETNPELARADIVSFGQVSSCGTSTAVSLPCMFSAMSREDYDDITARYTDNLLDVLQRSGLQVVWVDNNSGCKGVCDRVDNVEIDHARQPDLCEHGECHDMVLLDELDQVIAGSERDLVVVLHQIGSHGPAYFLRTPEEYQVFQPLCNTNQLQECSQKEIVNAYDNTVLYTDHVLASLLRYLASQSQLDTSLLYVSDHGESLGENNLYLHGLPYLIAPEEQTHVPMVFWMDDGFASRFAVDKSCLNERRHFALSHDNLFASVLGLLDVKSTVYRQDQDMFAPCRSSQANRLSFYPKTAMPVGESS